MPSCHHAIPHELWLELTRNNALFKGLSAVERAHLRTLTTLFLQRKTFSGAQDLTVSMEMAVTIAAQACLLILKLGLDYYDDWREVVIYPCAFRVKRDVRDAAGVVSNQEQH